MKRWDSFGSFTIKYPNQTRRFHIETIPTSFIFLYRIKQIITQNDARMRLDAVIKNLAAKSES